MQDLSKDEKATHLAIVAGETKNQALALLVRTPYEYEQVSAFVSQVKGKLKEVDGYRTYLKEPYLEGGRRVDEFFRSPLQFLKEAETAAKSKLLGYEAEQRRLAEEEQRKLEAKAWKEREALEEKARKEREEADRKAAEARQKAEEARMAGELHQAVILENQAIKIEEKSEIKATAAEIKAAQVVTPKVEVYIPPVVGQSSRTIWKARVVDVSQIPREYMVPNDRMLNDVAGATKGKLVIPGIEFYSEQVMSARAR